MARDCRTYQEKLSVFVDGRLSPKEAAAVAAHLADCPDCAALVDQMKRLNEMASATLPEVNPALLATLERRIQAEVDRLPTVDVSAPKAKARIFPIWYRYAAAAASVIIVLAIGRQWYRESGMEIVPSKTAPREMQMTKPPALGPSETLQIKPSEPAKAAPSQENRAAPMERQVQTKDEGHPAAERQPASSPVVSPSKWETEGEVRQPGTEIPKPVEPKATEQKSTDLSQSITVSSMREESGVKPEVTTPITSSEEEKAKASRTKEAVPPVGAPPAEEKSYDKQIISPQDIERMIQGAAKERPRPDVKGERSPAQQAAPAGSLHLKYVEALSAYRALRKYATGFQAAAPAEGDDSLARVEYVFQQATARPDAGSINDRATRLYLMARAQYDSYRFTKDSQAYDRASELRDSLLGLLNVWLSEGDVPDYVQGYQDEVEQWRPQAIPATER